MKSRINSKRLLIIACFILFAAFITVCDAQGFRREGLEIFGIYQMVRGDTAEFSDVGVKLGFNDNRLYGFGLGINLSENINVNTDVLFSTSEVDISTPLGSGSVDADLVFWDINVDYNILRERFSPVISAGAGFFNSQTSDTIPSIDETDVSFNFGAGVRWDVVDGVFFKAMYRWTFTKIEESDENILFDGLSLSLGLRF